jgi:hypothetical protein
LAAVLNAKNADAKHRLWSEAMPEGVSRHLREPQGRRPPPYPPPRKRGEELRVVAWVDGLGSCGVLQKRNHARDHVIDGRPGWKYSFLIGVLLPVSLGMRSIADDQIFPAVVFYAP